MPIAQATRTLTARQATDSTSTSSSPLTSESSTGSGTTTAAGSASTSSGTSASSTAVTSSTTRASTTSDQPFFPYPSTTETPPTDSRGLEFTKNAVEGALIIAAVALIIALTLWRLVKLRRRNRPLGHFFRAEPQPDVPARRRAVPRTTGLPPIPAPPAAVICDMLPMHVSAPHGERRRGRGHRPHAGDIDAGGRRGNIAHPDDPDEFLPVYDDKDVLPRYQDVESRHAPRYSERGGGRFPNAVGGTSDTIPLVTRLEPTRSTTSEYANAPAPSTDSHEPAVTQLHPQRER
ncbi:hypothetical protein C8Q74DRAFT_1373895 [Fomes fomentarius]|nr:hypothetical protein C8Q74DRAFT_1373895 [Fomes fomentarius]